MGFLFIQHLSIMSSLKEQINELFDLTEKMLHLSRFQLSLEKRPQHTLLTETLQQLKEFWEDDHYDLTEQVIHRELVRLHIYIMNALFQ